MTISNGYSSYLMKRISFLSVIVFLLMDIPVFSQPSADLQVIDRDYSLLEYRYYSTMANTGVYQENESEEYPAPKSVLIKSLIIPGWGQIENRQIWKVPIVYGIFAGIGVYAMFLHDQYSDYRAAHYNSERGPDTDFRFGPTPERLEGLNTNELLSTRNSYRNQRDMMFVAFGLAYALNAIDAYVFAHMRSFDVSDDLSFNGTLQPTMVTESSPGVSLSFSLKSR